MSDHAFRFKVQPARRFVQEVAMINVTPHEVTLLNDDNDVVVRLPAAERPARVEFDTMSTRVIRFEGHDIEVVDRRRGWVMDLPAWRPDAYLVVSRVVAQAVFESTLGRRCDDLLVPDDLVRDGLGRVIGCRRFALA